MASRTLGHSSRCSQVTPGRAVTAWTNRVWRAGQARVVRTGERVVRTLATRAVAIAFWVAVIAPFLTLGLLFGGLQSPGDVDLFTTLVVVNLIALGVGHQYRHPDTGANLDAR